MAATFELEVATAERLLFREAVSEAQIPGKNGYLGVLPEHAPTLSELGSGVLQYVAGGKSHRLAVSGGFVEILGDRVRVLANRAERAEEIDLPRAQSALQRAQERLTPNPNLSIDIARALDAMLRAQARIDVAAGAK